MDGAALMQVRSPTNPEAHTLRQHVAERPARFPDGAFCYVIDGNPGFTTGRRRAAPALGID